MKVEENIAGSKNTRVWRHSHGVLFLSWLALTLINITKAYHIDDVFHLEAAQAILHDPFRPMSGLINWNWTPEPVHHSNQPALFFFCLAQVSRVFGTSEIPQHLLLSGFTFLALYFFYKIARLLRVKRVNTLLIFFAFCPAFIVNQNLLTDVPILSLTLGFAYFLIKAGQAKPLANYSLAASLLGLGLLIKYSLLPLLVVLVVMILFRRHFRYLLIPLIPMALIGLWSLWNIQEYGAVHILTRPKGEVHWKLWLAFTGCVGAISAFSLVFLAGLLPFKVVQWAICILVIAGMGSVVLFGLHGISQADYAKHLYKAFFVNGILLALALLYAVATGLLKAKSWDYFVSPQMVLFLILITISIFIILFAPFIATRHVLLIIPFLLLTCYPLVDRAPEFINRLGLAVSIALGILLGISDWAYADCYRQLARRDDLPSNGTLWTLGHWGWQWYSIKSGMKQYNVGQSQLREGDYILYPAGIVRQIVPPEIRLEPAGKRWKEGDWRSFFYVGNATMYNSFIDKGPWMLSRQPLDTLLIYRVGKTEYNALHKE